MKKLLIASFLICFALTGFGQITGSAHDFSGNGWSGGEICIVCHTPHNADQTVTDSPLWNHEVTAVASYTVYSSPTLDAAPIGQPSSNSKLCLSCHDGTVAIDSYGGTSGGNFIAPGNAANFGTDLSNHHPITFDYTTTLATTDGGLFDPSSANSGLGGTIAADMLFDNSMECGSCHDVHRTVGVPNSLLIMSNAASALCLTCHNK